MWRKHGFNAAIILLTVAAFAARALYIERDYFSPDEPVALAAVNHLQYPHQWDSNWLTCRAPAPYNYNQFTFSSYHYTLYAWDRVAQSFHSGQVERLRLFNAVLGALAVLCIGLTGKVIGGRLCGIAAAATICVNPTLIQDAHYIRCESFLTTGSALLLYLTARLHRVQTDIYAMTGGLLWGILIACKISALFLAPVLLLFLSTPVRARWQTALAMGLGTACGFAIGAPSALAQPQLYMNGILNLQGQYANALPPHTTIELEPSFLRAIEYYGRILGLTFCIVAAIGAITLCAHKKWYYAAALVLSPALALWAFGREAAFIERSYSPFLPMTALLIGVGVATLRAFPLRRIANTIADIIVGLALLAAISVPTIYSFEIIKYGFSCRERDARLQSIRKIKAEFPQANVYIVPCCDKATLTDCIGKINPSATTILVIADFYDAATIKNIADITTSFHGQLICVRESLWPEMPTCTLHTFLSPRLWFILFPPQKEPAPH